MSAGTTAASGVLRTQMRPLACAWSRHWRCQQHVSCTRLTATRKVARGPGKGQWQRTVANTPRIHEN